MAELDKHFEGLVRRLTQMNGVGSLFHSLVRLAESDKGLASRAGLGKYPAVEPAAKANQAAWNAASQKHVREYGELLAEAAAGSSLTGLERDLLRPILGRSPAVVHLQSGNGTDDAALVRAGAASVVGVDYSQVAVRVAQRRADELGVACRYVLGEVPQTPLASESADLIYTGKGALIWMPDLAAWAGEITRLLRPCGHLFIYEEHPMAVMWTWDEDRPRIRPDRDYFGRSHVNDTFPARGAVEWQWRLGDIVTTLAAAGMEVLHLGEHAEPFWRMGDVSAAAWDGRLPNSFSLLARLRRRFSRAEVPWPPPGSPGS